MKIDYDLILNFLLEGEEQQFQRDKETLYEALKDEEALHFRFLSS